MSAAFLATVNGFDLLLTLLGTAGWVAYFVAREPREPRWTPTRRPAHLEQRPYDWHKDGL